eukprot:643059-Amphidinium_carterae.1
MLLTALRPPMVIPAIAGNDLGALFFESLASEASRRYQQKMHMKAEELTTLVNKMTWAAAGRLALAPLLSQSAWPNYL